MNIVISNDRQNELINFNVDVIKNIVGTYEASDIIEMFGNFYFDHMIIDVTAINHYDDYKTFQKLTSGIDAEKLILWLPEGSSLCTPNFLARLISFGIYNFTTNFNGVVYLINKPNTYKEVENIVKLSNIEQQDKADKQKNLNEQVYGKKQQIIGFRNVTPSAGASTLIFMLRKELAGVYGQESTLAIEINKGDFVFFYDKRMISIRQEDLKPTLSKFNNVKIILIDLNTYPDDSICDDVIYLVEPSTLKLNKMIRTNRNIFQGIASKKVVLNQSLLLNEDIFDFETESNIKVFFNIPPLDERKKNPVLVEFLTKIGLIGADARGTAANATSKIFGLFRR